MPVCICGFSTEMPNCNGTHRIVKAVRESIVKDIESNANLDPETLNDLSSLIKKAQHL